MILLTPVSKRGFEPGAQPKVKRVPKYDRRADFTQLLRAHRLDGPIGADRYEDRCFNHTVRHREATTASVAVGSEKLEMHEGWAGMRTVGNILPGREGYPRSLRRRPRRLL